MNLNLGLRAGAAIAMTLIAVVSLTAQHFFGTAWSNRCDPGNAQFNLLKSDPVVSFHAPGELFTWENDSADNSWLCTNASLSVSHVGDTSALYPEVWSNLAASGWTEDGPTFLPNQDFDSFYKDAPGGGRLTALVRKEAFWVEVDLDAPALHLGESGFQ